MSQSTSPVVADLDVQPLPGPFGAQVAGISLRETITAPLRAAIHTLLFRHRVLVWRDQPMDTADQVRFAQSVGSILVFSSVVNLDPARPGVHEVHGGSDDWHFDASSLPSPPVATMLRAVNVPPSGGDTLWASNVAAYETLTPELRELITSRYVTHGRGVQRPFEDERPVAAHRLVRRHPATGELYLYLNLASWDHPQILGMPLPDSDALIERLRAACLRPENHLRVRWSPDTLILWDNRLVQHRGVGDYGDFPRHLIRICLADLAP
ncbi:TauD/TfdA dioxygenase family protein [Candidatus Frankia nodulisporulans]|uniref:TauD/TfdA dioxygenase family protein n=1 Tax=Candidatus Frankia nodulisporulans TaxID=2060052 RepID=UPI001582AACF|nr:TauD/TfdA family dioxygenase [Candidatus Frankia nodulisporulans]